MKHFQQYTYPNVMSHFVVLHLEYNVFTRCMCCEYAFAVMFMNSKDLLSQRDDAVGEKAEPQETNWHYYVLSS